MVLGLEDGQLALSPLPGASMGGVRVPMGKVRREGGGSREES